MTDLDRIRAVAVGYGVDPTYNIYPGVLHDFFDFLDIKAGIRTRDKDRHVCSSRTCNHTGCRNRLYVGERLAHHEARLKNPSYHFWLGSEG